MKRTLTILSMAGFVGLAGASSPSGCGASSSATRAAASRDGTGSSGGSTGGSGAAGLRARARLSGYQEVPAISTPGSGRFEAELSADGQTLTWMLTYADLKGNAGENGAVTGAHLHLGQRGVAGGVAIHLCGGGGGTEACPAPPASLTGTATADNVVGPAGQGLDAGQLADLIAAMRAGVTYVNVHTTRFPTGEIRGQLRARPGHDRGGDDDDHGDDDDDE